MAASARAMSNMLVKVDLLRKNSSMLNIHFHVRKIHG